MPDGFDLPVVSRRPGSDHRDEWCQQYLDVLHALRMASRTSTVPGRTMTRHRSKRRIPRTPRAWPALRQWFPPGDQTGPALRCGRRPRLRPRNARRKAMVVDPESGRVPVRPEAAAKKDYALAHLTDSWEYHTPWERCITRGVPAGIFPGCTAPATRLSRVQVWSSSVYEMIHEARIIPVDGRPHLPPSIRLWNGDSRGHWEGNTLVVDITNYNDKSSIATNIASQAMRRHRPERAIARGRTLHDCRREHHQLRSDDR